jgi:hypothetical protein
MGGLGILRLCLIPGVMTLACSINMRYSSFTKVRIATMKLQGVETPLRKPYPRGQNPALVRGRDRFSW